jgi:hypothetical protein
LTVILFVPTNGTCVNSTTFVVAPSSGGATTA